MAKAKVKIPPTSEADIALMAKAREAYAGQLGRILEGLQTVPLLEQVAVMALINYWSSEDMTHIRPLDERQDLLCPTWSMSTAIISAAANINLLNVSVENSLPRSFVDRSEGGKRDIRWYTARTALLPSVIATTYDDEQNEHRYLLSPVETYDVLKDSLKSHPSAVCRGDIREVMMRIAVAECCQFYESMLNEYGFDAEIGEKTEMLFRELLAEQSVSHVLPSIWAAVRSAAAFLQTAACHGRKHAFNSIHGKIQDEAAKRRAGQYKSAPFERSFKCPRSAVSMELYGILGFDADVGFTTRLSDIPLPEVWTLKLPVPGEEMRPFDQDERDWMYENFNATYMPTLQGFEVGLGTCVLYITEAVDGIEVMGFDAEANNTMFEMTAHDFHSLKFMVNLIREKFETD